MLELLGEAYGSAGAGEKQFEKTQESLTTKLNNLKTAWTEFTTSIASSTLIKGAVDALTLLLNTVNKLTDAFGSLSGVIKLALGAKVFTAGAFKGIPALRNLLHSTLSTAFTQGGTAAAKEAGPKIWQALSGGITDSIAKKKVNLSSAYASFKDAFTAIDTDADLDKMLAAEAKVEAARKEFQKAMDANKYDSYLTPNLADAATAGAEEGLAKAKAEQAAVEAHNGKVLPKRIAESFTEGKAQGGSWSAGFSAATEEVKKTKAVQNLGKFFGTTLGKVVAAAAIAAVTVAIAVAITKILDPVEKAKAQIEKYQKEIDANKEKIDEYNVEISELEAQEELTAAEKVRLKWLKKQTEELEAQNEAREKDKYESWTGSRENGVKNSEYLDEMGIMRSYKPQEYADKLVNDYQNLQDREGKLDPNSEHYQRDYDNLEKDLESKKQEIQKEFDEYSQYAQYLNETELASFYKLNEALGNGFDTFSIVDEDTYNEIMGLADAGNLTTAALAQLADENPKLQAYLEATGQTALKLASDLNQVSEASAEAVKVKKYQDAAEELKNVKKSVDAITDAVSNLYKDGYVDIDKLSTIVNDDAFNSLPSFENFFDILSKAGKEDIPQVAAAMEQLLAEYVSSETVLTSLNDTTAGLYENMLKNMGVTNASEVVEQKLIQARAKEAVATMEANNELGAFMGTSEAAQNRLTALAKEYNTTEQAIAAFVIKTRLANSNYLSTKASRAELSNLVKSLNLTAEALQKYQNLINLINSNDSNIAALKAGQNAAATAGDEIAVKRYGDRITLAQQAKTANITALSNLLEDELSKIESNVNVKVDTSQFNTSSSKSSSSTEKEIQKLSELYNAKKKVAEIEEEISDLEEARKTLQDYDEQLANEHEQIEALKEKKKLTQELIDQNEILRKQKLAAAKTEWASLYNYDETTHEITLTQEYFNAINKNGKATKKWSADVLNNFKDWVEEYDDIVEFSRDEQNILAEINTTLLERWESYRDDYIDLVNELADLYEKQEKDQIDALKEKYDKMKELDDKYLEELRKNIEARRDARDRENDIEEITKKQKRLNMLMRDTSGRNASEIADLQKEIEDAQQDVIDEDVDRILDSLEDANDQEQENWDNAIQKLEDQLEQDKENGKFIRLAEEALQKSPEEIKQLFKEFYETQGPYSQAEIIKMLEEVEDKLVGALDYRDGKNPTIGADGYGEGSNGKYRQTKYLDPNGKVQTGYVSVANGQTYKDTSLTERIDEGSIVPNATNPNKGWKLVNGKGQEMTLSDEQKKLLGITSSTSNSNTATAATTTTTRAKVANTGGKGLNMRSGPGTNYGTIGAYPDGTQVDVLDTSNSQWWKVRYGSKTGWMSAKYLKKYAKGGLVDYTGPAWVDGNPSQPEAFLDAKDTKNFTELKEILANFMREGRARGFGNTNTTSNSGNCTIYVNVDQISSDYDIDEAVARVKQEIMNGSSYRNVNLVNRRR